MMMDNDNDRKYKTFINLPHVVFLPRTRLIPNIENILANCLSIFGFCLNEQNSEEQLTKVF